MRSLDGQVEFVCDTVFVRRLYHPPVPRCEPRIGRDNCTLDAAIFGRFSGRRFTGDSNHAFNKEPLILRIIERDDVSALWLAPPKNSHPRERNGKVVRQFVNDDPISRQDRGFHAAGRHLIPISYCRPENEHDDHENNKASPLTPELIETFGHRTNAAVATLHLVINGVPGIRTHRLSRRLTVFFFELGYLLRLGLGLKFFLPVRVRHTVDDLTS